MPRFRRAGPAARARGFRTHLAGQTHELRGAAAPVVRPDLRLDRDAAARAEARAAAAPAGCRALTQPRPPHLFNMPGARAGAPLVRARRAKRHRADRAATARRRHRARRRPRRALERRAEWRGGARARVPLENEVFFNSGYGIESWLRTTARRRVSSVPSNGETFLRLRSRSLPRDRASGALHTTTRGASSNASHRIAPCPTSSRSGPHPGRPPPPLPSPPVPSPSRSRVSRRSPARLLRGGSGKKRARRDLVASSRAPRGSWSRRHASDPPPLLTPPPSFPPSPETRQRRLLRG